MLLEARLLIRFTEAWSFDRNNKKQVSLTQMQLSFALDTRFTQIPGNCQKVAVRLGRDNGIHASDKQRRTWMAEWGNKCFSRG